MAIKILTKNGVENTNIDGARDCNFNAGNRDGIVKSVLKEGNLFLSSSNVVALDTCELRIFGHRIVIDEIQYRTFSSIPDTSIRYALVGQIIMASTVPSFSLIVQYAEQPLQKDNINNGDGTYEVEIGRFTLQSDGMITDLVRTLDVITGGVGDGDSGFEVGTVTTNSLDPGLNAEVDVENRYDEEKGKVVTDFTFGIPVGSSTTVVQGTGQSTTDVMSQKAVTDNLAKITTLTFGEDVSDYDFADVEVVTGITTETDQNSIKIKTTNINGGDIRNSIAVGMAVEFYDANGDSTDVGLSVISYINYTTGEVHLATYSRQNFSVGEIFATNIMRVLNRQFRGPITLTGEQKNSILTNVSSVIKNVNDIYSLYHVNSLNTLRVYLLNLNTYSSTNSTFYSTEEGVVNRTRIIELVRDAGGDTWYACHMVSPLMFDLIGTAKFEGSKVQISANKNIIAQPGLLSVTFTGKKFTCTESAFDQLINDLNMVDWGDNSQDDSFTHTYSRNNDDYIINFLPDTTGNIELPSTLLSNITGLKKVVVGDKVTKIGGSLCQGCTTLEEFVIGKNVTDITNFSIISGTPIKTLRVLANTPPTCGSYDAQVPNLEKIIVPKSAINAYKSAAGWSTYADKIVYEVDSSDIPDTLPVEVETSLIGA